MVYLLLILAIVVAIAFIIGNYFFKKDALFVLGIGSAVSSNVYNVNSYSISVGELIFGLDSVIYLFFVFCVMVAYMDYGKKTAMAITYSSMAGIMLTAIFDFFAKWATIGIAENVIWGFVSFSVSVLAIFVSIYLCVLFFEKTQDKLPILLNLGIVTALSSFINSAIYFGIMYLLGADMFGNFGGTLLGSLIGKLGTLVILILAYLVFGSLKGRKNYVLPIENKSHSNELFDLHTKLRAKQVSDSKANDETMGQDLIVEQQAKPQDDLNTSRKIDTNAKRVTKSQGKLEIKMQSGVQAEQQTELMREQKVKPQTDLRVELGDDLPKTKKRNSKK